MKRKDFFLIVIAAVVMAVVMKCFNQNADDVPSDFPELEKKTDFKDAGQPSVLPLADDYSFEEEPAGDIIAIYKLAPGDKVESVEWKDTPEHGTSVVFKTEQGVIYYLSCQKMQNWELYPRNKEYVFSNGSVLTVRFEN